MLLAEQQSRSCFLYSDFARLGHTCIAIEWWRGQLERYTYLIFEVSFCGTCRLLVFNKVKRANTCQQAKQQQLKRKISSPRFAADFFTIGLHMPIPIQVNCILEVLFLEHLRVLAHCITDTNNLKLNSLSCSNGKIHCVHWPSEFLVSCWLCDSGKTVQWAKV